MPVRASRHYILVNSLFLLMLVVLTACSGAPKGHTDPWPTVQVLPLEIPEGLDQDVPTAMLRRGNDGFWYAVGGLPTSAQPGTFFLGRYSGDWPLSEIPRPALVYGQVLRRLGDDVALVQLLYRMPDTDVTMLELSWEHELPRDLVGKGYGVIAEITDHEAGDVMLSLGSDLGVQVGDMYAMMRPVDASASSDSLQMSRQLAGLCMVRATQPDHSICRQWRGHSSSRMTTQPGLANQVVFLEHTLGSAPRQASVLVAQVEGAPQVQSLIERVFSEYLSQLPASRTGVDSVEITTDARKPDFHRYRHQVAYDGTPQILVGASIHDVHGKPHLYVNYTGVGPSVGPGMIAAPPEHGVDLGPINSLDEKALQQFAAVVFGGVLAYRGQTAEALMHLHQVLSEAELQGPLRWHARDQYAMRWAALDYLEEALWLVLQDEAVATQKDDEVAYLNALGTRVRLYDFMELQEAAYEAAALYLQMREARQSEDVGYLVALSMYAEMAMQLDQMEQAHTAIERMHQICPDGCQSDLGVFLSGLYWTVPAEHSVFQRQLIDDILQLAQQFGRPEMLAAARLYQGLDLLREEDLEQALIAFLEAERLYNQANFVQGAARAKYFVFLTQLQRGEPQNAFEYANRALNEYRELGDFRAISSVYERIGQLFLETEAQRSPQAFLAAARQILLNAIDVQMANGHYGKVSEAMMTLAGFLLRTGQLHDIEELLQEAGEYGIRAIRFDLVALSHMYRAIVARHHGDIHAFRTEIQRAIAMAHLAEDPTILEMIERFLSPQQAEEPPTQLL